MIFPLIFYKSTMLMISSLVVSIFPELIRKASLRFDNSDCAAIDDLPSVNIHRQDREECYCRCCEA